SPGSHLAISVGSMLDWFTFDLGSCIGRGQHVSRAGPNHGTAETPQPALIVSHAVAQRQARGDARHDKRFGGTDGVGSEDRQRTADRVDNVGTLRRYQTGSKDDLLYPG